MKATGQYFFVELNWVCGWNPTVWPFKWKLLRLSSTFLWYCLLCSTRWLSTSSPGFLSDPREPWERGWVALTFQSLDEMLTSLLNEGSYVLHFAPLRLITITCHCLANSPFAISSSPAPLASFSLKASPTTKKTIQTDTTIDCTLSYFRVGTADPVGHHMVNQSKKQICFLCFTQLHDIEQLWHERAFDWDGRESQRDASSYQQARKVNKFCTRCTRFQVVEVSHAQPISVSPNSNPFTLIHISLLLLCLYSCFVFWWSQ